MAEKVLLLVANFDSNVGYAWWLMESFWVELSKFYKSRLAYPSITKIPLVIENSTIEIDLINFVNKDLLSVIKQLVYIYKYNIKIIYFTDQELNHWRYIFFKIFGLEKIIVHSHTSGAATGPVGIKRILKFIIQRIPFYSADAVFAVSEYIKLKYIEASCLPCNKCFAIQNGIPDYIPIKFDTYKTFNIPRSRKIIVSICRATKHKGVHTAIEILSKINRDDWHYLMIGDGPDLEEFKQLSRNLNVYDRVTFAGKRSDVRDILPKCYMGLHPSNNEAFSLAILEIMQAGLPVVVPDVPTVCAAIDDLVGVVYSDTYTAVSAIEHLLENSEISKKIGQEGAKRVHLQYSLRGAHESLIKAMRGILHDF